MVDLKPCPFCGSADVKIRGGEKWNAIQCQECFARGPDFYLTAEVEWNTRFEESRISELEAENARLRAALAAHCKNDGLPNEAVLDRVIERIEDASDAALAASEVNHD